MRVLPKLLFHTLIILVVLLPVFSQASEVSIRPFLIDETLNARGVVERTVTINNAFDYRKVVLYATVNEITLDNTGEIKQFVSPVMTDRTNTVTSWIEVTRGRIEVEPSGTTDVTIIIRTHPFAEPGEYHVFVGFVAAANRPKAEAIAMAGDADGVLVKITIADERKDSMKISGFLINRFVTGEDQRVIDVQLENLGDVASSPVGEIIFYDSRGIEIGSSVIDSADKLIQPGEKMTLQSRVPIEDSLGRFKANLSLKYGENQQATLYDTAYFYMMPLQLMLVVFVFILLLAIGSTLWLRRAFATEVDPDGCEDVTMYVKDGHDPEPKDHDIDLKNIN